MSSEARYGIIVLAAGNSSRLGEPKQLLRYHDASFIHNAVEQSLAIPQSSVIVVTGASNELVEQELEGKELYICYNEAWSTGMASSIKAGISKLLVVCPGIEAVLITVCDQPFLTKDILASLIQEHDNSSKGIIASAYHNTLGTPVLFSAAYFEILQTLQGQEGAKKIILQYPEDTATIDFPLGGIDIDTAEDYQKLTHG